MESIEKIKAPRSRAAVRIISGVIFAAALAWFGYWLLNKDGITLKGIFAAAVVLGFFALAVVISVPGAIRFFTGAPDNAQTAIGDRSSRKGLFNVSLRIVIAVLLARMLIVVIAYVFGMIFRGVHGSLFSTLETIWLKLDTDAPHYFSIAEEWYVTSEPQMYNIVFLPLFPLCIRALNLIFGNSFVSAMALNTVCSCAAAVVLYHLALQDVGRRSAKIAVLFAFAMPAAIFFIAPMSEALFLLLSVSTLLALRKGRFLTAAVFGGLAAFTRSPGIIMAVPFTAEAVRYAVLQYREKGGKGLGRAVLKLFPCLIILLSGAFGYLLINKLVWGDWFKFLQFQRDIWYQQPNPFFDTAALQTEEFFLSLSTDRSAMLGLWLPNLLYIVGALAVFVASARTLRTSYSLYFAAYFAVVCGASWLLSAPRYLTALAVLPIALTLLCEGRDDGVALGRARAKTLIVSAVLITGQILYLLMYVIEFCIY